MLVVVLFYILGILLILLILFRLFENRLAKQICRVLDRLLIDIALRRFVENYDKRHIKNKKNVVDEAENQVYKEIERLKIMNKDLLKQKNVLNEALKQYAQDKEVLLNEKEELIKTNEFFASSLEDLQNTIKTLSYEQNSKVVNKIPSKANENIVLAKNSYLYAEPDATGTILRKISQKETKYSLFKLELLNEQVCKFYVLNNAATPMYINNRSISLLACHIVEVAPNPTKFEIVEAGTAVKNNNSWIVMEPAKIKIL